MAEQASLHTNVLKATSQALVEVENSPAEAALFMLLRKPACTYVLHHQATGK